MNFCGINLQYCSSLVTLPTSLGFSIKPYKVGPQECQIPSSLGHLEKLIGCPYILVVGSNERANSVHYHQYVWAFVSEDTSSYLPSWE